jgi:outer membrane protein
MQTNRPVFQTSSGLASLHSSRKARWAALGAALATTLLWVGAARAGEANPAPAVPATNAAPGLSPELPERALGLAECLDIALQQNALVLKSQSDLEAAYGVVVQTRAVALPKLQATGQYGYNDQLETLDFGGNSVSFQREQSWNAGLRLVQSVYEGGRIRSALKTASLTKEQALLQHQVVLQDVVALVRIAYYDVLLAAEQIVVQSASVKLLEQELEDTTRRYNAGTVPRFNVLRSEVELANAKPQLIQARNDYRIAKNNLAQLLGYRVPAGVWEDIPLKLAGKLEAEPYSLELPAALAEALGSRPELRVLEKNEKIQQESVRSAKGGYLPSVQLYGGYGWRSSSFQNDLGFDVAGWNTGVQLSWNIFDGLYTKGKVQEAKALLQRSRTEYDDRTRLVELEVRTAYSVFVQAREILESQKKVREQAEEALRLANARYDAGSGTQLDVLNARTSLTQASTTQIKALRDYAVARARMERAMGRGLPARAP